MNTNGSALRNFSRAIGALVVVSGLVVIASWYAHWQKLLQLIPHTAPMQFNTALCFIASGAALFLLTLQHPKMAIWLSTAVAILTSLTLLEYLTASNLGVDLLFFKPYFEEATTYPGRMSPLAAMCFILTGIGTILAGADLRWRWRQEVAGLMMCVVAVISFVALIGFIFGIESAYGWGAYSSMAVNTACLFLLLSVGVFMSVWQLNHYFVRWLPATASVTLMVMVAFVAIGDVRGLKAATFWRKHTIQVILTAQSFENDLIDLQRGMRAYVLTGDTNGLAAFQNVTSLESQELALNDLTRDNLEQTQRLKALQSAVTDLLAYDNQLITLYQQQGSEVVFKMDSTGTGRTLFGRAHDVLKQFSQEEQGLLDRREASEGTGYRNTERLLVVSCVLAALLLLVANFMASRELSMRRRAEAKLALQANALRRSNEELKQFAYVASHDLREPLRTVAGFSQILKRQLGNQLDEKAGQTIERIVDGTKRMANIIDDLLMLSSINSRQKPFEMTGLEKPLGMALENLSVSIIEKGAVVRHGSLPSLPIDSSQLVLLFQNLIGNAIKFCSGRKPEVQIDATREAGGYWKVSVRDNGIGIEPKYFDKIFGIFQRLHTREAYPGTGIGLAICKKIVERHGGNIWLESTPGVGTTFYFTIPEQQQEKYNDI